MRGHSAVWWVGAFVLLLGAPLAAGAEPIVFPPNAGVVDVTKRPYNAKADGKIDATLAIQRALSDHANGDRIIYLPGGTYLVSDTLKWGGGSHGGVAQKRTILQGAGMDETVLRLRGDCAGFNRRSRRAKPMIWTGQGPAQRFRNGIRDLTIETGKDNPWVIGVQFIANNQGSMRRVRIACGEAGGSIGLDLGYTKEQGPCLIQDVHVTGFDVGVNLWHVVDSVTMERVTVEGQMDVGVRNDGQCVSIRGLTSVNTVPAVRNLTAAGVMTLIDSQLTVPKDTKGVRVAPAAIENAGVLFARNVGTAGYKAAVDNQAGTKLPHPGPTIDEYVSHAVLSQLPGPERSLGLAIEETPHPPIDPLEQWVAPDPNAVQEVEITDARGQKRKVPDHTAAIQKAIDSGKTTLYFPRGNWQLHGTVLLRGNIRRVTGLEGAVAGTGKFRLIDGPAPAVLIERFNFLYQKVGVENASGRVLAISGVTFGGPVELTGKGDLFLEDVCCGELRIKGQRVWARQLNIEAPATKIVNDGGRLWVLGYKTEREGTLIETRGGGRSEVLGGFCYATGNTKTTPMFTIDNASLSVTIGEASFNNRPFYQVVRETREGETKLLKRGAAPARCNGTALPLYVGRIAER